MINGTHKWNCALGAFCALVATTSASADTLLQGSSAAKAQVETRGAEAAEAVRVDHAPKLDGTLDDPLWQSAKHLYIIYNVGTQFASIAPANPPQVRETRFAVKWTYAWQR